MRKNARSTRAGVIMLSMFAVAACAKTDSRTDTAAAAGSTATTAAATRTAATSAASGAVTSGQRDDFDTQIRNYRLTDANVTKTIDAMQKMHALEKSNPQLSSAMEQDQGSSGDAKSIDEMVSRMDAMPPVKGVLSSAGISTRDFVLTSFELAEAGAAYQFQKAGKLPPNSELAKSVSPENLAYIGAHQQQMQALAKANSGGSDQDQ